MSVIKSFSVNNGDMFYIKHGSDNFTIIDCCMCDEDKADIVTELKTQSIGKGVTRFISTHPDDDHIGGLVYLHKQMNLLNFYCVQNAATKKPECWTEDFGQYCELRDDAKKAFYIYRGCSRKWMNQNDEERKTSGIEILWPIVDDLDFKIALTEAEIGESPNNISPIFTYSLEDGITAIWMGDLETSFQEDIKDKISLPSVDVLFAPHHGRDSGMVIAEWLEQMSPNLIIIGEAPSEYLNYYAGYNTITQNSAGAITLDCGDGIVDIYVSNDEYSAEFLDNHCKNDAYGATYIGTLTTKATKTKATAAS